MKFIDCKKRARSHMKYIIGNVYCCTVHYGIYILFTHQQIHFLLNLKKFKFT